MVVVRLAHARPENGHVHQWAPMIWAGATNTATEKCHCGAFRDRIEGPDDERATSGQLAA